MTITQILAEYREGTDDQAMRCTSSSWFLANVNKGSSQRIVESCEAGYLKANLNEVTLVPLGARINIFQAIHTFNRTNTLPIRHHVCQKLIMRKQGILPAFHAPSHSQTWSSATDGCWISDTTTNEPSLLSNNRRSKRLKVLSEILLAIRLDCKTPALRIDTSSPSLC